LKLQTETLFPAVPGRMTILDWSAEVLEGDRELEADPAAPGRCRADGCGGGRYAGTFLCRPHDKLALEPVKAGWPRTRAAAATASAS
jgi:hypothetical protein